MTSRNVCKSKSNKILLMLSVTLTTDVNSKNMKLTIISSEPNNEVECWFGFCGRRANGTKQRRFSLSNRKSNSTIYFFLFSKFENWDNGECYHGTSAFQLITDKRHNKIIEEMARGNIWIWGREWIKNQKEISEKTYKWNIISTRLKQVYRVTFS